MTSCSRLVLNIFCFGLESAIFTRSHDVIREKWYFKSMIWTYIKDVHSLFLDFQWTEQGNYIHTERERERRWEDRLDKIAYERYTSCYLSFKFRNTRFLLNLTETSVCPLFPHWESSFSRTWKMMQLEYDMITHWLCSTLHSSIIDSVNNTNATIINTITKYL